MQEQQHLTLLLFTLLNNRAKPIILEPGVGIDATCASQMWPLCTASAEQSEGLQRIEEEQPAGEETIITLAVPYKQANATPASESATVLDVTLEPTKVDAEVNAVVPDATRPAEPAVTCPKNPDGTYQTDGSCIEPAEEAAAIVVIEEPTKVVNEATAQEVIPDSTTPASPCVTCPGHGVVAAEVVLEEPTKIVADAINAVIPDSTTLAAPCVTCPGPEASAAEVVVVEQPTKVEAEANADIVPDATHPIEPAVTCPKNADGNYESENSCIQSEEIAATVVVEEPTKVAVEDNAVVPDSTGPAHPDVTCPRGVNGEIQPDGCIVHEEAAVIQEEVAAPVAPVAEVPIPAAEPVAEPIAPVAEPVAPAAEPIDPVAEPVASTAEVAAPVVPEVAAQAAAPAPAAAVETVDALTLEKEKVQAAFEEDTGSCSSQLAIGEQDPLVNEYMIETLAETATCSEARQEALNADVQARVARYEAAQTAPQAPTSA